MENSAAVVNPLSSPREPGVKPGPESLRSLAPLSNLSRKSLRYAFDHTLVFNANQGDILFEVGDTKPYTFFLLRGALKLKDGKGVPILVESGSERARYAIANLLPRQYHVQVVSKQAVIARIDRDLLEKEVAWGQLSSTNAQGEQADDNEWKINLLHTPLFFRLPMANVQKLFEELEEVPCNAGDTIIREGDPGDCYYIMRKGQCKVVRSVGGQEIRLNTLKAPESFGDEALVSHKPRNATIVMETDGILLRLSGKTFQDLMQAPLVRRVEWSAAQRALARGKAQLIDVRMEEEFAESHLPRAQNIPLILLYLKTRGLKKKRKYIVYCDTGNRSEAAAFILTRNGFHTYLLSDAGRVLTSVN